AATVDDLLGAGHHRVPGAGDVDVHDVSKVVDGDLIPHLGRGDARVGDDDVEAAEGGDALGHRLVQPLGVADVDFGGEDAAARGVDEAGGLGAVFRTRAVVWHADGQLAGDVDRDDVRALAGHPDGVSPALAAGGSGDDGHLAGQPSAH